MQTINQRSGNQHRLVLTHTVIRMLMSDRLLDSNDAIESYETSGALHRAKGGCRIKKGLSQ